MRTLRKLPAILYYSGKEFGEDNCSQMAAGISYYVLFSIFPLLIFAIGVAGLFLKEDSGLQQDIIDLVLENIPLTEGEGRNQVTDAVNTVSGSGGSAIGVLGLLGMAWSSSAMFATISRSINVVFDLDFKRPVVRRKLLDLALVLALTLFFFVSLAVTAALRIARAASDDVPGLRDAETLGFGWTLLSFLIPTLLSFLAFLVLYTVVPVKRIRLADAWLGALIGALLFEIAKHGFGIYVSNFKNFDVIFGSLGAIVAFLFWVYVSANALLFGAEIATEYPKVMNGYYVKPSDGRPKTPFPKKVLRFLRRLILYDDEARPKPRPPRDPPPAGAP